LQGRFDGGGKAITLNDMKSEEQAAPRYEGDRVAAVSQIHIALRGHTQQEPTELYLMKLVYIEDSPKYLQNSLLKMVALESRP
jgi:hypothetical protein